MEEIDIKRIIDAIEDNYWVPLYNYLSENPKLIKTFPAFLLSPEMITLHIGKTPTVFLIRYPEKYTPQKWH